MPGIINVHGVNQQKVRRMLYAQMLRVSEQVRVGVMIVPVKMPVLDREVRCFGMTVAGDDKRRAVIQFADPVIGRRGRAQARFTCVVEHAALVGQARHIVVHDAAVNRRHAGQDALVQRA